MEFQYHLSKAQAGGSVLGRHLIQSFAPGETTPEQAHEIGKRLANEILGGRYAYVLATHVDRGHIHNHFVWCAVNIETHRRYISNKATYRAIQNASDKLCAEYGLSIVTDKSGLRGKSYTEYQADRQGTSWKTLLRRTIDAAIRSSDTYDGFLTFMQEAGYDIKHGKHISFRAAGQERFTRTKTIGDRYTEERIRQRIAVPKKPPTISSRQFSPAIRRMVDRHSEKVQSSGGYRQWANLHNLKSMAETLIYLQQQCNGSLTVFERRVEECITRINAAEAAFHQATQRIAADGSLGVGERIRQHNDLKACHAKETAALKLEYAELNRIRENLNMMQSKESRGTINHRERGTAM